MKIDCLNWHNTDEKPNDGEICILMLDDSDIMVSAYDDESDSFYVNFGGCGFVTKWSIVKGWSAIEDCRFIEE